MKLLIKYLILINLLGLAAWAQDNSYLQSPEAGMNSAAQSYRNGKYDEAYRKFTALAEKFHHDSRTSSFQFMAAKSLYRAGDFKGASMLWEDFIETFPGSSLRAEAELCQGHSLYKTGRRAEAAAKYLAAIQTDPKSEAALSARENLAPLVRRGLTIEELQRLIQDNPDSPATEQMEFALAQREIDAGYYRKGISSLRDFLRRYPGSRDFKQAKTLLDQAALKSGNEIEIGLLAPASGNYQDYGRSMIEGARLAVKEAASDSFRIELSIKDTQGDPIIAADMAKAIAEEEPVAVVGPLRSESAVSAAIVLNERGIPMITPTASEKGIARTGPNIFQISSPIEAIGQAIGRYAAREMGIKEFAIIASDDAEGIKIAKAFSDAVDELGGNVILARFYAPGTTDFKGQIAPLREILLTRIDNQLASGRIDSADFRDNKHDGLLPREDWPVKLGGLFLPGDPEDLKLLIPQVKYHVIRTQFLGGDGWDSTDLLQEVGSYVKGAIYATDFHVRPEDSVWMQFDRSYAGAYGHSPDRVATLTYDAVRMVVRGILDGVRESRDMRLYLSRVEVYPGASGCITFKGSGRVNNGIAIYSVNGKRLAEGE